MKKLTLPLLRLQPLPQPCLPMQRVAASGSAPSAACAASVTTGCPAALAG